jgi:hypothetical protein
MIRYGDKKTSSHVYGVLQNRERVLKPEHNKTENRYSHATSLDSMERE